MKVKVNGKAKIITITPQTSDEKDMMKLIVAFADKDAVLFPTFSKSALTSFASFFVNKIVIDMTHKTITKEFIQSLLRLS